MTTATTNKLTKAQQRAMEIAKAQGGKIGAQKFVTLQTLRALDQKGLLKWVSTGKHTGYWELAS